MKVFELINILKEYDGDLEVVVYKQEREEPEVLCILDADTNEEYVLLK